MSHVVTRRRAATCGAVTLLVLAGCGDDVSPAPTDATADVTLVEVTPPLAPAPAAPPVLTPCPDGWREIRDEHDVAWCEPWPEGGRGDCAPHEAHRPGEPGCTLVGSPCPTGEYSNTLPSDRRVVYVRPGATGGTGTLAQPWGRVDEFAWGGLSAGTVVALSTGTHAGPVTLQRDHRLIGACAAATTLTADGATALTSTDGSDSLVRDLTVTSNDRGIVATGAATLSVSGVVIAGAAATGISSLGSGTVVHADDVAIVDTQLTSAISATGILAWSESVATIRRAAILRNASMGALAGGEATLTIEDSSIVDS